MTVGFIGASLKRLNTTEQVVQLIHCVGIEAWSSFTNWGRFVIHVSQDVRNLVFKFNNTLDRVLGWVLASEDIHQLSHVQSVTLNFGQLNGGLVLQLIDFLSVLVDKFLVCIKNNLGQKQV